MERAHSLGCKSRNSDLLHEEEVAFISESKSGLRQRYFPSCTNICLRTNSCISHVHLHALEIVIAEGDGGVSLNSCFAKVSHLTPFT